MQESTPGIVFRMRVSILAFQRLHLGSAPGGRRLERPCARRALAVLAVGALLAATAAPMRAQIAAAAPARGRDSGSPTLAVHRTAGPSTALRSAQDDRKRWIRLEARPPRVIEAERFLARRGWTGGASGGMNGRSPSGAKALLRSVGAMRGLKPPPPSALNLSAAGLNPSAALQAQAQSEGSAIWLPLGPVAVESQSFGLVTGGRRMRIPPTPPTSASSLSPTICRR
jgi:hypothetical protein